MVWLGLCLGLSRLIPRHWSEMHSPSLEALEKICFQADSCCWQHPLPWGFRTEVQLPCWLTGGRLSLINLFHHTPHLQATVHQILLAESGFTFSNQLERKLHDYIGSRNIIIIWIAILRSTVPYINLIVEAKSTFLVPKGQAGHGMRRMDSLCGPA